MALNLVFLVPGETGGMETYARELIPRLAALDGLAVTALVNRETAAAGDGPWGEVVPMEVVPVRARNRLEWVRGEQLAVPRIATRLGAELVHSLGSTAPLRGRQRRVTTIQDLNYLLVPEAHAALRGVGMRLLVPAAARRSHRLIAPSEATRHDLVEHLGVDRDRVDVVALGVAPPAVAPVATAELRARLDLGAQPVVLMVGATRPHKNAGRVVDALAAIPAERRPALVVTGYAAPGDAALAQRAAAANVRLVRPDWLAAADLERLYGLAAMVVVASLREGFGLPVLEAMIRGVPVACSDRSSLPEVAGGAALLFDPEDADSIRAAIERLLADETHCRRLAAAGRARAAELTWDRTAQLTARSYERALA